MNNAHLVLFPYYSFSIYFLEKNYKGKYIYSFENRVMKA